MSGWYFVLGCLAGSVWTLLVTRSWRVRFPRLRWPSFAAKYAAVTVGDTGGYKIQAIKEIRAATGYGLYEAKQVSEGQTAVLERHAAHELVTRLNGFGIKSEMTPKRRAA